MGQDLLLAWSKAAHYDDGTPVEYPVPVNVQQQIRDRIVHAWDSNQGGFEDYEEILDIPIDHDGTIRGNAVSDEDRQNILDAAYRDAETVIEAFHSTWRTIVTARFCDRWYVFAGGMSWGDNPSDEFQPVFNIDNLQVFEEPFDR